ncbi:MAG: glycosyltransferase, partial [Deltaproteobacteria bacterium]
MLEGDPFEVIVVDGGSRDRTREIAEKEKGVTLIASEKPGRALQMNEGARASSGDVLLFLHADTLLPRGWKEKILEALERNPDSPGGAFLVALSGDKLIYRITGAMINVRTLLFRSFTGDQGIFVRREFFRSAGGFPDVPIMEDLMLSDAMRPHGPVILRKKVVTSARRWEDWGPVRTIL